METYLSTETAAAYLGIKERKLYELVANGAVPCSKVTGKWLFPRAALDRWIEAGLAHPDGFVPLAPPAIIGGSHDPLLEWAVRRSACGLALLSEGSTAGLDRLGRNEIAMAAIHVHGAGADQHADEDANIAAVKAQARLTDAVVIAFARREQGLLTQAGNPLALTTLGDVATRQARLGVRQGGAGAQLLLDRLAAESGLAREAFNRVGEPFATGQDLAFAIRAGEIDCGIASRAVAAAHGLGFVPLAAERFDLVMRRRIYFEPAAQTLLALMREPEFHRHAALLTGYDISEAGTVRFNR
ncbi:MAG: helix-turn-helix transcriptional regulator [Beijerinckiaceae bacterium]|nr:helix-turn-helix transcriptional regulator [Beijerinckiaceae bacterium]